MIRPTPVLTLLFALLFCACSKEKAPEAAAPAEESVSAAQVSTPPKDPAASSLAPVPAADAQGTAALAAQPADRDPVATHSPNPEFPEKFLNETIEGEVQVQFTVTPQGRVDDIDIVSTTDPAFAEAVKKTLPDWLFAPAIRNGEPVERRVLLVFPFIVKDRNMQYAIDLMLHTETQPLLSRYTRPANPNKLKGDVLARVDISATAMVEDIEIVKNTAGADPEEIKRVIRRWMFLPFVKDGEYAASQVLVGFTYAPGGSVLLRYPYPETDTGN